MTRSIRFFGLVLFVAAVGCDGGDADAPDGGPDPGLDASTPPGTDGGEPPAADAGGGDDGGAAPDAGPVEPGPTMQVRLDRPIVERDNEQLVELGVTCIPRDADGLRIDDPGDLEASVSAGDAAAVGDFTFTFPSRGSYVVTCRSESLGLEGTERVEVAYEGIDRDVIRLAASGATIGEALDRGFAAARAGDEAAVRAAAAALDEASAGIDVERYRDDVEILVPFPPGWPTAADARAAGLDDAPDDAAWGPALDELSDALTALRDATDDLPTSGTLAPGDDADYVAASERFAAAAAALEPLEPSPAALLASMDVMNRVATEQLPGAMRDGGATFGTILATADVPPPGSDELTLVGALVRIGIQHVVSNYSYQSVLKKLGRAVLESFLQMAIADLIDELIPPDLGAPEIELACGASCSFLAPGNPWTISGDLWESSDPSEYAVIFIHPNVPGLLLDVVDLFTSARDVLEGDHWIQIAKNIYDIIKSIRDVAASTHSITNPDRVILRPESVAPGSPDLVSMPPLPTEVNCSLVPQPGTFIPVRYGVGRGPSFEVNITNDC
ncbi:MAG TPA: hypothetical protein RMH99_17960 [Sandaracinaceae bacterium LLY-WYZ-13_1]|nr:hypothetical protein [Sandaracinaceae bacterium LLY-WYZ-13_1]